jgi:hypothetical protein
VSGGACTRAAGAAPSVAAGSRQRSRFGPAQLDHGVRQAAVTATFLLFAVALRGTTTSSTPSFTVAAAPSALQPSGRASARMIWAVRPLRAVELREERAPHGDMGRSVCRHGVVLLLHVYVFRHHAFAAGYAAN